MFLVFFLLFLVKTRSSLLSMPKKSLIASAVVTITFIKYHAQAIIHDFIRNKNIQYLLLLNEWRHIYFFYPFIVAFGIVCEKGQLTRVRAAINNYGQQTNKQTCPEVVGKLSYKALLYRNVTNHRHWRLLSWNKRDFTENFKALTTASVGLIRHTSLYVACYVVYQCKTCSIGV